MSGKAILRYLLAANANLVAVVPAARIQAGELPLKTLLPAISVRQISGRPHNNVAMQSASYIVTDRVQVTVNAKTVPEVEAIIALVRAASPLSRGTVNGYNCQAVIPDLEGPDFSDSINLIESKSQDYFVKYIR